MAAPLAWTSWPLRDDYPRSLALVATVLGLPVAVAVSFESPPLGVLSLLLLAGAVLRYLVPTRYELDDEGAHMRFLGRTQTRRWPQVRAFYAHHDGVHLSPFPRPSPLDPFRGLYVRFAGNREEVLAFIAARVPPAPPAGEGNR